MTLAFINIGAFFIACLWWLQAVHVLKTGDIRPFFFSRAGDAKRTSPSSRPLRYALVYAIPGFSIALLLLIALAKANKEILSRWTATHLNDLLVALALLASGLVFLARPEIIIKWAKNPYPELEDGPLSRTVTGSSLGVL